MTVEPSTGQQHGNHGLLGALETDAATRENMEDYTLRFALRSYRRWLTGVVAVSALGGIAYLADFAIGANNPRRLRLLALPQHRQGRGSRPAVGRH